MIGTTLDGKYKISRQLGAGAMGAVYEAEHTATGRRVAVKVISSGDLTRDSTVIGRFQREARAAGAIDTQHITQVLDAGTDHESGLPFLVMEFMSGEDLSHLLKRVGPLSPDLSLRIVAQACLGLQKAHEASVVHRDMKPANLFLAKRDAGEIIVKVLDFGIAKVKMDQAHEGEDAGLTKTGSMIGSPLYMSPEQARGNVKGIDHRTDLWSIGIVLYQCLSGRTPYQNMTALGQLIIAICSEWPQHIQEVAPWVPAEVAAIVHRCLRHNPDERYQSANEMFQAIRALLPNGWTINEDMILPLQDTQRNANAAKFALTSALAGAQTAVNAGRSNHIGSSAAVAVTQIPDATITPAPKSKVGLGIGVAAVLVLGAGGAYLAARPRSAPAAQQATVVTTTTETAAPPPPPAATPTATAPTVVPAADTSIKRVQVVIMPPDVSIEIEGKKALAKSGLLEISGVNGSVHRVRIWKGKTETITDVIVTEAGPSPPKIELTFGGPKPSATAAAPPPPNKPGITKEFE